MIATHRMNVSHVIYTVTLRRTPDISYKPRDKNPIRGRRWNIATQERNILDMEN